MLTSRTPRSPVDEYLTALNRALGPRTGWMIRRHRADLLQEARDSLDDATEAFEAEGLDRREAEERALADFGEVSAVAPGYRAELATSAGRRTATMLCLVLLAQPIVWTDDTWHWDRDTRPPSELTVLLNHLVETTGMIAIVGAVLAVVALGIGLRYPAVRDRATKWTAAYALVCAVTISLIGIGLGLASSSPGLVPDLGAVGVFVLLPLSCVGFSANRTLRLARG